MDPEVLPFPKVGQVVFDARGTDRCLRVSWRPGAQPMVVSLWRGDTCVGTIQLSPAEASRLIGALATGLAASGDAGVADQAG